MSILESIKFRASSAKKSPFRCFLDPTRQTFVDQIVDFTEKIVARDENLLEERQCFVVIVNLAF